MANQHDLTEKEQIERMVRLAEELRSLKVKVTTVDAVQQLSLESLRRRVEDALKALKSDPIYHHGKALLQAREAYRAALEREQTERPTREAAEKKKADRIQEIERELSGDIDPH